MYSSSYPSIWNDLMKKIPETGKLVVITGPMFSGKTSRLIELLERERFAGRSVVLYKPNIDDRYGKAKVTTHRGIDFDAKIVGTDKNSVNEISEKVKEFNVVGIDEAQFWDEDSMLPEALNSIADSKKIVYVSTLNKDYRGEPFVISEKLLALADEIYSLTAVCTKCGENAVFSQRIRDGASESGPRIVIGGKEAYQPRCRNCFVKP